jgi:hypothetical protein
MRSPPQIDLEPLPQAHRVVMSIEKLIDHERQQIAVVVRESFASWASNGSAARYQHDFSSNYIGNRSLSRATQLGGGGRSRRREVGGQVRRVHLEEIDRLGQAAESPRAKGP